MLNEIINKLPPLYFIVVAIGDTDDSISFENKICNILGEQKLSGISVRWVVEQLSSFGILTSDTKRGTYANLLVESEPNNVPQIN
ncbi:MAG: hypothetical protein GY795_09210 [Desulfobacterales bacterium]|nr:hypothetical protein [Desulfobacterales bacterium]